MMYKYNIGNFSLRSRRLEVVGERKNGRARGRHVCLAATLNHS